jgi:hypothetical protein
MTASTKAWVATNLPTSPWEGMGLHEPILSGSALAITDQLDYSRVSGVNSDGDKEVVDKRRGHAPLHRASGL